MISPADIERLMRRIVPDLASVPAYVVFASDLPSAELLSDDARGMGGAGTDLALKSHLMGRNLWHGRGPAIIVNDTMLHVDAFEIEEHGSEAEREEKFEVSLLAVSLHEMAHVLDRGFELDEPVNYVDVEAQRDLAEARMSLAAALWSGDLKPYFPRFVAHEIDWIRSVLHLRDRATKAGWTIPLNFVFCAYAYGLTNGHRYATALAPELAACDGQTFASIRATAPPEPFIELWRDDVRKWIRQIIEMDPINDWALSHGISLLAEAGTFAKKTA
jgi:hypothetical protein